MRTLLNVYFPREMPPAAPQAVPAWQPIDSAPKTGEWIIVCDSTNNVRPDYWLGSEIYQWAKEPHGANNTHWMPLPDQPPAPNGAAS